MVSSRKYARAAATTAPIALAFLALALVEVSYFPGRDSTLHVAALRAKAIALAEVTANSAMPALEFDDDAVLLEFLNGVARDEDVVQVVACASDGAVIRSVGKAQRPARCPTTTTATRVEMSRDALEVVTPIAAKTHPGALLITFRTDTIVQARQAAERVALAIGAGILLLGFGVSWWIARSLLRLQGLLEENRAARARAEAANEAKSAFLANMSHEIRTPMNGVLGVAQLLAHSSLSDLQRRYVQTITRSGELLLAVINDILDFSKVEAGKLSVTVAPLQVRSLVAESCEAVRATAQKKGLTLRESVARDVPEAVSSDDLRLRQVLLNLLSNAIKFTAQGSVSVSVTKTATPDARLRFEVTDTGIGIESSHHETLFEAFTQVDDLSTRRHGGTGLGLAICKRLVTLMNGALGVQSTPGAGSTFWFELPLVAAEWKAPPPTLVESSPAEAKSGVRLLAVDDNEINRGVIEHMAQQLGFEIDLVEGGRAAVERIKAGARYSAILMDCQMPEVDGYMATREIRDWEGQTQTQRTPIVAVTAHALAGEEAKVRAAGMDSFLPKPVRMDALRTLLTKWTGVS